MVALTFTFLGLAYSFEYRSPDVYNINSHHQSETDAAARSAGHAGHVAGVSCEIRCKALFDLVIRKHLHHNSGQRVYERMSSLMCPNEHLQYVC